MSEKQDIDSLAARIHQEWLRLKLRQGVASHRSHHGDELLLPWHELTPRARAFNRRMLRFVLKEIVRA